MSTLWVAAGGGGDAFAASLVARIMDDDPRAPILTWSWDRLAVDPWPGPRGPGDFTGLRDVGELNHRIAPVARLRGPGMATVSLLAERLANELYLIDPDGGSAGIAAQMAELVVVLGAEQVRVVDVGGDVVAAGDGAGLRSPLADGLVLAAVASLGVPAEVVVLGAGLDGELSESEVLERCRSGRMAGRIDSGSVGPYRDLVETLPTESTTLLLAAAEGVRGRAEVRDSGLAVFVTDHSTEMYVLPALEVASASAVAASLAGTRSLRDAEERLRRMGLGSEIDYERAKVMRLEESPLADTIDESVALAAVDSYSASAARRGINVATLRRLGEVLGLSWEGSRALARVLRRDRTEQCRLGLWHVRPGEYAVSSARLTPVS